MPGETLGIIECSPAAYISLAANEAEKVATIKIIQVNAVGRYGRLFVAGTEAEVASAIEAAIAVINAVVGRSAS